MYFQFFVDGPVFNDENVRVNKKLKRNNSFFLETITVKGFGLEAHGTKV